MNVLHKTVFGTKSPMAIKNASIHAFTTMIQGQSHRKHTIHYDVAFLAVTIA